MRALVALLLALTLVSPAFAQPRTWEGPRNEPSEAAVGEARSSFVRGTELAAEGRWADALEAFERAYSLSGVLAALFNVATTLRSLGRYVDARDAFDQVLRANPDDDLRDEATRLRAEVAARVALVIVGGVPRDPRLTFWIDGTRAPLDDTRPVTRDVDPGPHTLRLELEGHTPWLWEGHADDGARLTLEAELVVLPPARRRRPGLWVTVGLVVAGALATGAYFLFFHDRGLSPGSDQVIRL
ncbi:MAG: tetratricopeptide repeat protein [Sandaracinus sp.]|nr:tetratricopeptide repeat protein [Sandaracinus sp.]MCB9618679.1 tetratricopeptide repeat protein [Sandaracinus sp.]